ncbi:MAG: hypothetical protein CVU51_15010 [Deltaproteobacteria bacterium HGW-Deltaproteobacteria-1]|jgi:hypothetical protein|nr:MAG: hypothetical protein CVU51_15010 [Deltaproteobacteria bacterium HGW-Deltaproteobacteria-1]
MRKLPQLLIAVMISLILCGYSDAAEKRTPQPHKPTGTTKGAKRGMKTYYMGRFAIDLPEEFELEIQSHRFQLVEIEEYPNIQDAEQRWKNHLAKIEKLKKPKGVNKIIIKEQPIDRLGKWSRGVLYYGDSMAADECKWDFLISYGRNTVLFSLKGLLNKEKVMYAWLKEVANAYSPFLSQKKPGNHSFYTQHGVIELPYKRQESTYARFAGPMGMKLRIEMKEMHRARESKEEGLISRTIASMATGFTTDVDIKKVRSTKRTAAGLPGEEQILRTDDGNGEEVDFILEHLGDVDSGERPWIQITVDTNPDNLDEKIKIWDAALDSFRPAYKR